MEIVMNGSQLRGNLWGSSKELEVLFKNVQVNFLSLFDQLYPWMSLM